MVCVCISALAKCIVMLCRHCILGQKGSRNKIFTFILKTYVSAFAVRVSLCDAAWQLLVAFSADLQNGALDPTSHIWTVKNRLHFFEAIFFIFWQSSSIRKAQQEVRNDQDFQHFQLCSVSSSLKLWSQSSRPKVFPMNSNDLTQKLWRRREPVKVKPKTCFLLPSLGHCLVLGRSVLFG